MSGRGRGRWADRDRMRKRGTENHRQHAPMFSLPRAPDAAQPSKADLREEAERAAREWARRYDPTGEA